MKNIENKIDPKIENKIKAIDLKINELLDEYWKVLWDMPNNHRRIKYYEDWRNRIKKARRAKKRLIESTIIRPEPVSLFSKEEIEELNRINKAKLKRGTKFTRLVRKK